MITLIKFWIEKNAFDFFSSLSEIFGVASSRVRLFFLYTAFLAFSSPLIIRLILYFWSNLKRYIQEKRSSAWELE
jgi:phage shock protein C